MKQLEGERKRRMLGVLRNYGNRPATIPRRARCHRRDNLHNNDHIFVRPNGILGVGRHIGCPTRHPDACSHLCMNSFIGRSYELQVQSQGDEQNTRPPRGDCIDTCH